MSAGEKEVIDKRIEKVSKQRIDAIAKKLLPKVKTAERERRLNLAKGGSSKQEEVTETTGAYFKGVEKEKRDDRERHFDRNAKKADDDASAYKPAPGDKEAKTKESKHTKKARAMGYIEELVWEDLVEGLDEAMWGQRISKKPHMLMDKNNKVKFDKRFKMYKPKVQEDLDLGDIKDLANSTEDFITEETEMRSFSQFIKEDWVCGQCSCDPCTCGEENLSEDAAGKSLKSKAEKSGMPAGVLRQVYNRGVAAWKTGHRPGTTPEQWGHARVNSFITKSSGTWGKADKDLAAKVRKEEVELDEVLDTPKAMNSYRNKAKTSKDKATNSAVANILRKGDHSADLKTRAKREKGLKMADRNATKKTVKALRGESIEEKNGLWANIHAKRARGEKMRKKGEEGAPTPEAIKRAQESFSEDLDAIMSNLDMVNEVTGAGEQGTPELTKKYKKDTPMEDKK